MALRDNMLAWYDLDEASGTRYDAHSSFNLTDNNTVGSASDGGITVADFEFDNSEYLKNDSFASVANNVDLSMMAVVKFESLGSAGASRGILTWVAGNGTHARYFSLRTYNNAGSVELRAYYSASGEGYINQAWNPTVGIWYQIIVEVDIDGYLRMYVNNSELGTAFDVSSMSYNSGSDVRFIIGAETQSNGTPYAGRYMDGLVKYTAAWNKILSSTEKASLYNSGSFLDYAGTSSTVNLTVSPSALVLTSSLPTPTVSAVRNVSVAPDTLTLTASLPTPAVSIDASVTPDPFVLAVSLPTPAVTVDGNVTIAPAVLALTASLPAPTITAESNVTVAVSTLMLTTSLPTVTVTAEQSTEVTPSPLSLSISLLTPEKIGPTWTRIARYGDSDDWTRIARSDVG